MIKALLGAAFALGMAGTASAQTLNMMKGIDAPHYDAQRTSWGPTSDIVNMIQDTLVALDWDGRTPIPYLAKSWTVSPDGKLYTFKLRDDVTFCSGKKMTAEDVIFTFKRLKSPETKGPFAWRAGNIKESARARSLHRRVRAGRAVLRAAAAAHHVHQRHPQQGQCRGAGQGLRRQGRRRHRAVVPRVVAAAHRDHAEAPRRLQVGPVDVPEQGAGEVREDGDQDRAGGFQPGRGDDGRPVRHHAPVPVAVHRPGQGRADADGHRGQAQLPAALFRLQDDAADGGRQAGARGDEHRHRPRRDRQGHPARQRRSRLHHRRSGGARPRSRRRPASSSRTSSGPGSCSTRPAGSPASTASARRTA